MPGLPVQEGSSTALTPEVFQRWKEAQEAGLRRVRRMQPPAAELLGAGKGRADSGFLRYFLQAREAAAAQRLLDLEAGRVAPTGQLRTFLEHRTSMGMVMHACTNHCAGNEESCMKHSCNMHQKSRI